MTSCVPVELSFTCEEPEGGADGDQPPIIFCHGLSASKEYWNTIPKLVAEATKRKVYAIDSRNHGDTEWSDVITYDANVADLLHFMDTIGARTATIVGHSMGGITAIRTALKAPERVHSIVVEDMLVSRLSKEIRNVVGAVFRLTEAALSKIPPWLDEEEAKKMLHEFLVKSLPPQMGALIKKETIDSRFLTLKHTEDGRLTFKCNIELFKKVLSSSDVEEPDCSGLYEGPACFIYGGMSNFKVGDDETNIKKFFPRAELIPVKNATHHVHAECKEEFLEIVLNFLKK